MRQLLDALASAVEKGFDHQAADSFIAHQTLFQLWEIKKRQMTVSVIHVVIL